jgi:hypothetical protein
MLDDFPVLVESKDVDSRPVATVVRRPVLVAVPFQRNATAIVFSTVAGADCSLLVVCPR